MSDGIDLRGILDRVKAVEGLAYDKDVAVPLNMALRNLGAYKERGTVPWQQLAEYAQRRHLSLHWLVFGEGPREAEPMAIGEPRGHYGAAVDPQLLQLVLWEVFDFLRTRDMSTLNAEKLAKAVALMYQLFEERADSPPQRAQVISLLELAIDPTKKKGDTQDAPSSARGHSSGD